MSQKKKSPLSVVEVFALIIETKDDPSTPPKLRQALKRCLAAAKHEIPAAVRDQVLSAAQNLATAQAAARKSGVRA